MICITKNQYQAVIDSTHETLDSAKIKYHQTLASLINADDVLRATVKIVDEYGNPMDGYREVVDHTPIPENVMTPAE